MLIASGAIVSERTRLGVLLAQNGGECSSGCREQHDARRGQLLGCQQRQRPTLAVTDQEYRLVSRPRLKPASDRDRIIDVVPEDNLRLWTGGFATAPDAALVEAYCSDATAEQSLGKELVGVGF